MMYRIVVRPKHQPRAPWQPAWMWGTKGESHGYDIRHFDDMEAAQTEAKRLAGDGLDWRLVVEPHHPGLPHPVMAEEEIMRLSREIEEGKAENLRLRQEQERWWAATEERQMEINRLRDQVARLQAVDRGEVLALREYRVRQEAETVRLRDQVSTMRRLLEDAGPALGGSVMAGPLQDWNLRRVALLWPGV